MTDPSYHVSIPTDPSYHNQRAQHERDLAETVAKEAIEIIFGGNEEPNRRGGCFITISVALTMLIAISYYFWRCLA